MKPFISARTIRNSVSVIASKGLLLILTFLGGILLNRRLGPQNKGIYLAIILFPMTLKSIAEMGIRQAILYISGTRKLDDEAIISNVMALYLLSAALSFVVCFVYFLFSYGSVGLLVLSFTAFSLPLSLFPSFIGSYFLGKDKLLFYNLITIMPPVVFFAGLAFLWMANGFSLEYVLIVFVLQHVCTFVVTSYFLKRSVLRIRVGFKLKEMAMFIRYGFVYALALFTNSLNYRLDVFMLKALSTATEIGYYSVGYNFSEMIWQIPNTIGAYIFSKSSSSANPVRFSEKLMVVAGLTFVVMVALGLVIVWIVPYIIVYLYGSVFSPSIRMFQLLLPGTVAMTIFRILNMDLAGKGKPLVSIYAGLPALALNLLINLWAIPRYQALGASIASSISYTVWTGLFLYFYLHEYARLKRVGAQNRS
jgi:O-antigen/teichoic acid export membrane protein